MRERANPSSLVPCVAIVLALLAGGAAAQQPSFTFNVPVRLQQVHHDVERIRVTCSVQGDPPLAAITMHRFIEPAGGDHNVDLVFENFMPPTERDLTLYTRWRCTVYFEGPTGVAKVPSAEAEEPWARVRPGAMVDTGLQPFAE